MLEHNVSPHQLRHFLFTWLKTQGIDDALIQPYSGHATRQSLEIYSRLALASEPLLRSGLAPDRHVTAARGEEGAALPVSRPGLEFEASPYIHGL